MSDSHLMPYCLYEEKKASAQRETKIKIKNIFIRNETKTKEQRAMEHQINWSIVLKKFHMQLATVYLCVFFFFSSW